MLTRNSLVPPFHFYLFNWESYKSEIYFGDRNPTPSYLRFSWIWRAVYPIHWTRCHASQAQCLQKLLTFCMNLNVCIVQWSNVFDVSNIHYLATSSLNPHYFIIIKQNTVFICHSTSSGKNIWRPVPVKALFLRKLLITRTSSIKTVNMSLLPVDITDQES